ncbi:hypothetical protein OROMI_005296 [Orobanche minor]
MPATRTKLFPRGHAIRDSEMNLLWNQCLLEAAKDVVDDDGERSSKLCRLGDDWMGEGNEGVKDVTKEMKDLLNGFDIWKGGATRNKSPAMDAAVRVYKPVTGLSEGEGDSTSIAIAGAAVEIVTQTMQVPLSYAEDIIGVGGSNIAYIRRTSGSVLTIQESRDGIEKIITSIGESNTIHQLFYEAETFHSPTWIVKRHVKPAKKKEKNITVYEDKFVQQLR